ncbi:hypothetical protein NW768_010218 [Fusarium equiseti]|uniref:Uncharacterized protein n=1 Tax=Fusarium equiseti TaxID=61235 RepID=A0ABQ8R189_FUSEQ|nr:hypothetical protein NW768_010218 [Fusarium equiseti]
MLNKIAPNGLYSPDTTIRFAERDATIANNPSGRPKPNTTSIRLNIMPSNDYQQEILGLKKKQAELVAKVQALETNQRKGLFGTFLSWLWYAFVILFVVAVVVSVGFLYEIMFTYLRTDEHEFHETIRELRRDFMQWRAEGS